jgi:hypothetical protein
MSDDLELRRRFANITPVPLPEELKASILRQASVRSGRRHTRQFFHSLFASCAAISAASVLVWGAWNYGDQLNGHVVSIAADQKRQSVTANSHNAGPSFYGLSVAPVSVGFPVPSKPEDAKDLVVATLTNMGTEVLEPGDVIGLLSFQTQNHPDALENSTWATFVDPPNQPMKPGETLTWSFRPIGVPQDDSHHFQGQPKLIFLKRGFVNAEKADIRWQKAPLQSLGLTVQPRQRWTSGQSFTVDVNVQNVGTAPVALNRVMAIVWFSNRAGEDWTDGNATRFMYQLAPLNSATSLAPGAKTTVNFRLIGPPDLDVLGTPVHVVFIWR